jgi:hypothetical protein
VIFHALCLSWPAGVRATQVTTYSNVEELVCAELFGSENVPNWVARTPAGHDIETATHSILLGASLKACGLRNRGRI